jgi:zinc-ribbon domain
MSNYTLQASVPQSFITKSKQRLKQFNDTVYLKNGDEFEIELYNPNQNKVLAKIELNGNSIGSGIIIRPGERVFLERYMDEAKKFLFETYSIDGNDKQTKQAIQKNGDVVVKFYNEDILPTSTLYGSGNSLTINNPSWYVNNVTPYTYTTHDTNTTIPTYGTFTTTGTNAFFSNTNTTYTSGIDTNSIFRDIKNKGLYNEPTSMKSLETGRVEKGSSSDQSFTYDYSSFSNYPSRTDTWKILPQSTKPLVKEDLVTYCTECGAKRKKDNHKFCPHCGTKF